MIKHGTWIWTAAVAFFLCFYPFSVGAAPREVTIFPDSAMILEVATVHLYKAGKELPKAILFLPGQADPNSLVTRLSKDTGLRIEDQTWRQVTRHDDEKIKNLRKQIQSLKSERNSLQAAIFSLETQIQFWQFQTKAKTKTLPDTFNIVSAIGKNIQKAYHDKLSYEQELERLNKQIKEINDELDRTAEKKETLWQVTILFSGSKAQEALLTYRYFLSGCGWQPMHSIDARLREKRILFSWEADIWQNSGQDWNEVDVNISTLQPIASTAPPDLISWIIKQRSVQKLNSGRQSNKADALQAHAEADNLSKALPSAPHKIGRSAFSLLQLGRKNLPTGLRQRFKIKQNEWPADFTYLIRPSLSSHAFVKAVVNMPESMEIPHGEATFMIDGAALGKKSLSFTGQEGIFFFGIDPLVTANLFLISKNSGEKTLLENKQGCKWDLRTDIQNAETFPVRVRIEYPCPQPSDERIKLSFKHDPSISEQDHETLIWTFEMAAGQKKSIYTTINITAPADMNLDLECK